MQIETTNQIIDFDYKCRMIINNRQCSNSTGEQINNAVHGIEPKQWVAVDDEVKEALSLYLHLKNHTEVQSSKEYTGMPICKICNKSAYQIMCEEWDKHTPLPETVEKKNANTD